jgi:YD repeat-containing protein
MIWLWLLFVGVQAQEVNLRNANLYVAHADVRVQRMGVPLEIVRVYNSRSNVNGRFGYGWTTNLDIVAFPAPDGSILVSDSDGFILRYTFGGAPRERVMFAYVDALVDARRDQDRRAGSLRSSSYYEGLRQELRTDPGRREAMGQVLQTTRIKPQTGEYISFDRGTEKLQLKADGSMVRRRPDGTRYEFDKDGKLILYSDNDRRGMRLEYDREDRLVRVTHTEGGSASLKWGPGNLVTELLDNEGRRVRYRYDEDRNLVQVLGPDNRKLAYRYDDEHNLTASRLADGDGFQVQYDKSRDWVVALKTGDDVIRYNWVLQDYDRYSVTVTGIDGQRTRHEYDDRAHKSVVVAPDGTRTETLLSPCCSKPLEVRHADGGVTRYDYDRNARLVGIEHPDGRKVRFAYHPEWSKIIQALYSDGRRYLYKYDADGNLIQAVDVSGRQLDLRYGRNGKVAEIRDKAGNVYTFRYDPSGRPVEIAKGTQGALSILYGPMGEISGTEILEGTAGRGAFYSDLREVLAMLEPATGQVR